MHFNFHNNWFINFNNEWLEDDEDFSFKLFAFDYSWRYKFAEIHLFNFSLYINW